MYMTAGRWNRHDKIPTSHAFDVGDQREGVADCMTWHYAKPSPPPPKPYLNGRNTLVADEKDGTLVTTTTRTTVQSTKRTKAPNRRILTPTGSLSEKKELLETKDLSIYRTEDVLPTKEYVTSTRQYYPPDYDVNDNRENMYKYNNGYAGDNYDSRLSSRYPYRSSLKKKDNLDSYRMKNGYSSKFTPNSNHPSNLLAHTDHYHTRLAEDSGYHSNRLNHGDARAYSAYDLQNGETSRAVNYKSEDGGMIHEDTLIDVIEDLQLKGEGDSVDARPEKLRPSSNYLENGATHRNYSREEDYSRRDLHKLDWERAEEMNKYGLTETDIKDLWRKHRDFRNDKNGYRQGSYRGMSAREKAAMMAHHTRFHHGNRENGMAWGPPPPRPPPSGGNHRQHSSRYARAEKIGPAEKEIRFNSRTDYHRYTPEDAYMERYENVKNKIDSWRAQSGSSRTHRDVGNYRHHQREYEAPEVGYNWHPPTPPRSKQESYRTKDITVYKPKELRYQVQAPYAESETGPRDYSVWGAGSEDVRVRVQCPPEAARAKVTVNVDMDPPLD